MPYRNNNDYNQGFGRYYNRMRNLENEEAEYDSNNNMNEAARHEYEEYQMQMEGNLYGNDNNNNNNQSEILNKNVPEGSMNQITMNNIKEGNILRNFRGNVPNSFESTYGRYYKDSTIPQIVNQRHPITRGEMRNSKKFRAHIVSNSVPKSTTANARRRKTRKSRKLRKSRRSRHSNRK